MNRERQAQALVLTDRAWTRDEVSRAWLMIVVATFAAWVAGLSACATFGRMGWFGGLLLGGYVVVLWCLSATAKRSAAEGERRPAERTGR